MRGEATAPSALRGAEEVLVVADDLTGAAETASALFVPLGHLATLRLAPTTTDGGGGLVVDTDARHAAPAEARAALAARLAATPEPVIAVVADPRRRWRRNDLLGVAEAVAPAIDARTALVLTGGETSRRVLHAAGVPVLHLDRELAPGEVVLRTDAGIAVALRPGSFGGPHSLRDLARAARVLFEY